MIQRGQVIQKEKKKKTSAALPLSATRNFHGIIII